MPVKNLFRKPFDEGTDAKLGVLKEYFEEWLPVFVSRSPPIWNTIQIFDFFAGQGQDATGNPGSPLIFVEIIRSLQNFIVDNKIQVVLHLNEKDPKNFELLKECISVFDAETFEIRLYNTEFRVLFEKVYDSMKMTANFLFFDQNGIKEITSSLFEKIIELKQTDFLLFISSSYFKRFAGTAEFGKYFNISPDFVAGSDYYHIHRKVLEHYKSYIPKGKNYFLAPFSIKKQSNIYGLIFGSNHTLGIEKFLSVCWKKDKLRGEANYDIDNERINNAAPFLFEEFNKPRKREVFERDLYKRILAKEITDMKSMYLYALNEGFQYEDANNVLKKLKQEGRIRFDFEPVKRNLHKETINHSIRIIE